MISKKQITVFVIKSIFDSFANWSVWKTSVPIVQLTDYSKQQQKAQNNTKFKMHEKREKQLILTFEGVEAEMFGICFLNVFNIYYVIKIAADDSLFRLTNWLIKHVSIKKIIILSHYAKEKDPFLCSKLVLLWHSLFHEGWFNIDLFTIIYLLLCHKIN